MKEESYAKISICNNFVNNVGMMTEAPNFIRFNQTKSKSLYLQYEEYSQNFDQTNALFLHKERWMKVYNI